MGGRVVGIVAAAVVIIWAASGFYTIKEAERGVVTRFGKFSHLVEPGLNWKPTFIDNVTAVNVESVRELAASGVMLTSDENVVRVEMNVQYRVTDPERYLFSVTSADDSLRQATDSALRGVIGKYTMDRILTEGRTVIRSDTQRELEETIRPYNMGITLLDVNFQAARPPEEVKAAFDDAIAARENDSSTSVKRKRTPTKFSHVLTVRRSVFWKKRARTRPRPSWKHRVKWLALRRSCRNIKPRRKLPVSVSISRPWKKC
jgi:membrane protease subunit HflK